jgi:Ca2+-binding RTX toxin-like protein
MGDMQDMTAVWARRRGVGRTMAAGVVIPLVVVASVSLSAAVAAANHADGCPESEPGPANGTTLVIGTSADERCLVGANGPDRVRGLGGDDRLIGNHGSDILVGGPGNDRLWGGRGPDTFICGPGIDRVFNNRDTGNDVIDPTCEIVR